MNTEALKAAALAATLMMCRYGDNGYACCKDRPCEAEEHNDRLAQERARLMAEAAPERILALLECVEALENICNDLGDCGMTTRARAALQKLEAL